MTLSSIVYFIWDAGPDIGKKTAYLDPEQDFGQSALQSLKFVLNDCHVDTNSFCLGLNEDGKCTSKPFGTLFLSPAYNSQVVVELEDCKAAVLELGMISILTMIYLVFRHQRNS